LSLKWDFSNSLSVIDTLPSINQEEYAMSALETYGKYVGPLGGLRFTRRIMRLVEGSV